MKNGTKMTITGAFLCAVVFFGGAQVGAQKTIVLGSWLSYTDVGSAAKEAIDKFEKAYPNIKVETQLIPYNAYVEKLRVMMAGGDKPDLLEIDAARYVELAVGGFLEPLDEYLTPTELNKLRESYVESNRIGGKLYGLIQSEWADAAIVRLDLVEEAGWDVESIKTWNDQEELAEALTKDTDGDGTIDRFGWNVKAGTSVSASFFQTIALTNNLEQIDFDNKENYLELLNHLSILGSYLAPEFATERGGNMRRMWGTGRIAMSGAGSWFADNMMSVNPDLIVAEKLKLIPFVQGPSQIPGQEIYWNSQWGAFVAFKDSPNKDAAIDFIKFITLNKENSLPLMQNPISPLKEVTAADVVKYMRNGKKLEFWIRDWFELMQYPNSKQYALTKMAEWSQFATAQFVKLMQGKQSPDETYEGLRSAYNRIKPESMLSN